MIRLYDVARKEWIATADQAIAAAADWVRSGRILGHPTSTVYGIGGRPHPDIDAEVSRLKGRLSGQPLIRVGADVDDLLVSSPQIVWSAVAAGLADRFWPGPLTLILPVPNRQVGIAMRVDPNPVLGGVLHRLGGVLTSTSLNLAGEPPARSSAEALVAVGRLPLGAVPVALLDSGDLRESAPSTIVRVDEGRASLVREGAIPWEAIVESLPPEVQPAGKRDADDEVATADSREVR